MRIAIAGASGTGKSTLARAISEKYNIPLNPIGARTVALEMGFAGPYDVDKAGKRVEFQRRLFEAKRDWELAHDDFVTDRSYFDNLTYCVLHIATELDEGSLDRYRQAMDRYDRVFVLSRDVLQKLDDGIRNTNQEYQLFYELILFKLCSRSANAQLLHGDLSHRAELVFQSIDRKVT